VRPSLLAVSAAFVACSELEPPDLHLVEIALSTAFLEGMLPSPPSPEVDVAALFTISHAEALATLRIVGGTLRTIEHLSREPPKSATPLAIRWERSEENLDLLRLVVFQLETGESRGPVCESLAIDPHCLEYELSIQRSRAASFIPLARGVTGFEGDRVMKQEVRVDVEELDFFFGLDNGGGTVVFTRTSSAGAELVRVVEEHPSFDVRYELTLRRDDRAREMSLDASGDFIPGPNGREQLELGAIWLSSGGRADRFENGGDLAETNVRTECWNRFGVESDCRDFPSSTLR
jgi:hypothetical protein